MGLLLISGVVPVLQTARQGVDVDIANVLAGFKIMLSPDKHEVVRIVVYYIWCVEGGCDKACRKANVFFIRDITMSLMSSIATPPQHAFLCVLQYATYLPWPCLVWSTWLCSWGPWFCIGKRTTGQIAWRSSFLFIISLSPCQTCSRSCECASSAFIIMQWLTEELLWHNKELIIQRDRKTFPPR